MRCRRPGEPTVNTRVRVAAYIAVSAVYILGILLWGLTMPESAYGVDYSMKLMAPGAGRIFGTDFMGRDMLCRCVKGLSTSISIAALAAGVSSAIALAVGIAAAVLGGKADSFINWCIDLLCWEGGRQE